MKKVIIIGGNPQVNAIIEAMMSHDKQIQIYGGRGHSKTFASQYVQKANDCIDNTPFSIADKIKDEEGYVHFSDFGRIHIQNWIDRIKEPKTQPLIDWMRELSSEHTENHMRDSFEYGLAIKTAKPNPLTAFQKRFVVATYHDPSGKQVRDNKIYDRVSQKHYTDDQFNTLYRRVEEIVLDAGVRSVDDICDECLNHILEIIEQADAIHAQEVQGEQSKTIKKKHQRIILNNAEIQSGFSRVAYAERLISQLPSNHDGRNTWLLNYGVGEEAIELRNKRNLAFDSKTQSAELTSK